MSKIKTVIKLMKNPKKMIRVLGDKKCFNWLPDKPYLKLVYWAEMGDKLNLDKPKTFNEKLQWIKLYDRKPEYSMYVDKYEVRKYIAKEIGEEYLIPLIDVYESVDEIPWHKLPKQFVLKCTHGSGSNIVCKNKDKLDISGAKKKLNKWMKKNWYWFGREWPYKNVKPRIICETYLGGLDSAPNDYKIMCFNGKPKVIQIHRKGNNGRHNIDYYDMNGEKFPFSKKGFEKSNKENIDIKSLEKILKLSYQLSKGINYLRTDFYLVDNKIYFGELTFFDSSGFINFEPYESNVFLGNMMNLK